MAPQRTDRIIIETVLRDYTRISYAYGGSSGRSLTAHSSNCCSRPIKIRVINRICRGAGSHVMPLILCAPLIQPKRDLDQTLQLGVITTQLAQALALGALHVQPPAIIWAVRSRQQARPITHVLS
jgi:hypothetical protein